MLASTITLSMTTQIGSKRITSGMRQRITRTSKKLPSAGDCLLSRVNISSMIRNSNMLKLTALLLPEQTVQDFLRQNVA